MKTWKIQSVSSFSTFCPKIQSMELSTTHFVAVYHPVTQSNFQGQSAKFHWCVKFSGQLSGSSSYPPPPTQQEHIANFLFPTSILVHLQSHRYALFLILWVQKYQGEKWKPLKFRVMSDMWVFNSSVCIPGSWMPGSRGDSFSLIRARSAKLARMNILKFSRHSLWSRDSFLKVTTLKVQT